MTSPWSVRPVGIRTKRDLRAMASAAERERRLMARYLSRILAVPIAEAARIYAVADPASRYRWREAWRLARRHHALEDADAEG